MKKVVISLSVILIFIFLVGCFNYKAYKAPDDNTGDTDLVNEIAQIENELASDQDSATDNATDNLSNSVDDLQKEKEKDVVLPKLGKDDGDVQELTVDENELVKLNVKAEDPDNDKVSYSFSPPLDDKGMWKTNYGDAGEYMVTLTATDGVLTTKKKVRIIVNRVNVAPVIGPVKDITVKEGQTVNFKPEVTDPNGDKYTVSVSEPLKEGVFVTDHTSAGEYNIKVTASDGELESEKTFKLTVENVNSVPEISGLEDIHVKEGEIVNIKPKVTDLDGDEVKLTISDPVGDDGVWQTSYTDHGSYVVTVTASDGKDTVTKKVSVEVEDVNKAPEFVEVSLGGN